MVFRHARCRNLLNGARSRRLFCGSPPVVTVSHGEQEVKPFVRAMPISGSNELSTHASRWTALRRFGHFGSVDPIMDKQPRSAGGVAPTSCGLWTCSCLLVVAMTLATVLAARIVLCPPPSLLAEDNALDHPSVDQLNRTFIERHRDFESLIAMSMSDLTTHRVLNVRLDGDLSSPPFTAERYQAYLGLLQRIGTRGHGGLQADSPDEVEVCISTSGSLYVGSETGFTYSRIHPRDKAEGDASAGLRRTYSPLSEHRYLWHQETY
jgi:hypothetical protein